MSGNPGRFFSRRSFLATSGAAVAAAALAPGAAAAPRPARAPMRVAIVGTGIRGIDMWGRDTNDASPGTTHLSFIDFEGNAVSLTATQGSQFGSCVVVEGLGLVLGHGMSRFDFKPGHANAPAAGKRPQHNMAPTLILRRH